MAQQDFSLGNGINLTQTLRYIGLGSYTNVFLSTDSITWTTNTFPFSTGTSSSNGKSTIVALQNGSSTFATSSDLGITWTTGTLPVAQYWNALKYVNNQYFGMPNASQTGILYSSDAVTWTLKTMPSAAYWSNIVYGSGVYAVSNTTANNANAIVTSTDTNTWTVRTIPSPDATFGINGQAAYGAGKFVFTNGQGKSWYSTDGTTWIAGTMPSTSYGDLAYINGLFYAPSISSTSLSVSTDGITWTTRTMAISSCYGIKYVNGKYLGLSNQTNSQYSTDGITWVAATGPFVAGSSNFNFYVESTQSVSASDVINIKNSTSNLQSQVTSAVNNAAPKTNPTFTEPVFNGSYGLNPYMIMAIAQSKLFGSTDGITWNSSINFPVASLSTVSYGQGKIMATSNINSYVSTNGLQWTTGTFPTITSIFSPPVYGNGTWFVSSLASTNAFTSTDGITWTTRTMPFNSQWRFTFGNGTFVAIQNSGSATQSATSTDGITWTTRTMVTGNGTWYGIAYGNGIFVAVSQSTSAASSTDGATWTTRTLPVNTNWFSNPCYGNGLFVAVAAASTSAAASTDGITWTLKTMPNGGGYSQIGYVNGYYVANGYNSSYTAYSTDATTWTVGSMGSTITSTPSSGSPAVFPIYTAKSALTSYESITVPIITSSYTVANTDKWIVINSSAIHTITLPNPALFVGKEINIKQIAAFAVNSATSNVQPLTSLTAGTAILSGAGKFARLVSNGLNWVIVESN